MKHNPFRFCTIVTLVLFKADLLTCIGTYNLFEDDCINIVDNRSKPTIIDGENVSILESCHSENLLSGSTQYKPPEDVKPRLLIVDIQNKKTTELLQYQRDQSNLGDTYTAVTPNLIFKIIDKNQVLWKAKASSYPYKVFVGDEINNQRQLQVYFPPGDNEEKEYTAPPQPELQNTLLEIDIKVKTTDQFVIFKKDPKTGREKFTCKPGFLIYKVYSGLRLMTEATNHKYFDRLVIYRDEFGNKNLQGLYPGQIDEGDPQEPLPVFTPPGADFALLQSEVLDHENHLVYVNVKNKMSTRFVTYEVDYANNVDIFTTKEPYRFALVMDGNRRAWKYKSGEYPNQALLFKDGKGDPFLRLGFPRAVSNLPKPKLITLDVRNIESNHEYSYEYDPASQTQTFRPKPGFQIDQVMKGTIPIWKCQDFIYPEKVLIFPDENGEPALRVQFPDQVTRQPPPRIPEPEPEPEPIIERVHPTSDSEMIKMPSSETDTTETIRPRRTSETTTQSESEPESITKTIQQPTSDARTRFVPPESGPVLQEKTARPEPRIRISEPARKREPLSRRESMIATVEPELAREKTTFVSMKYKLGRYVHKDAVSLLLDFTKRKEVLKYDTHVANHIYKPTIPHIFNKVTIMNPYPTYSVDLWEAKSLEECAYRVEQFGFHHVLIYSNNGTHVLFDRDDNDNWTRRDFPKGKEAQIKMKKPEHEVVRFDEEGKLDSTLLLKKLIHLDIAHKQNTIMTGCKKEGNVYTFRPGEGYMITGVMDSSTNSYLGQGVPIWDTGDPTQFCERVEHEVTEDLLTVKLLDGCTKKFKKVGRRWLDYMFDHKVDNSKKLPFVLNLSTQTRFATYEFESDVENKTISCTVKEGYAIKEVVGFESEYQRFRLDRKVWSTEDPLYFACRVNLKNLGFGEKVVTIDLFNGLQLTFYRSTWGAKWNFMGSKVIRAQ